MVISVFNNEELRIPHFECRAASLWSCIRALNLLYSRQFKEDKQVYEKFINNTEDVCAWSQAFYNGKDFAIQDKNGNDELLCQCMWGISIENPDYDICVDSLPVFMDYEPREDFILCRSDIFTAFFYASESSITDSTTNQCDGNCMECEHFDMSCDFRERLGEEIFKILNGREASDTFIGHLAYDVLEWIDDDIFSLSVFTDKGIPIELSNRLLIDAVNGFNQSPGSNCECGVVFYAALVHGQKALSYLLEHKNEEQWKLCWEIVKLCIIVLHYSAFLKCTDFYDSSVMSSGDSLGIAISYTDTVKPEYTKGLMMAVHCLSQTLMFVNDLI